MANNDAAILLTIICLKGGGRQEIGRLQRSSPDCCGKGDVPLLCDSTTAGKVCEGLIQIFIDMYEYVTETFGYTYFNKK